MVHVASTAVKQQDAERARTLLTSHLEHASHPDVSTGEETLTCLACGTPMHDDLECSACGWTYGSDQIAETATSSVTNSESTLSGIADEGAQAPENDLPQDDIHPALSDEPVMPVRAVWKAALHGFHSGICADDADLVFRCRFTGGNRQQDCACRECLSVASDVSRLLPDADHVWDLGAVRRSHHAVCCTDRG